MIATMETKDAPRADVGRLDLRIPPPKMLTSKEELEVARKAVARHPQSSDLVHRLSSMLVRLDHFDEAITLLENRPDLGFRTLMFLHDAYIGLETEAATLKARSVAERALEAAASGTQRAMALAALGKTYTRLGDLQNSERILRDALEQDPQNKDAYKRLSRLLLHRSPQEALTLAEAMIARGVLHSRVLGSVPLCLARMGRLEEAHAAEGLDRMLLSHDPAPPDGWTSAGEFNEALAAEILNHPDMRYERYGTASARTWRVDEPSLHRSRIFPQLQGLIRREVLRYVAALPPDSMEPLARACPAVANLRNWCVVTQGEGHETWHVHQNGWMSGVYYIHVQDHIANGTGPGGCLAFGISDEIAGADAAAAYGERLVRPHTGLMMMFPSHSFHKTYPHHGEGHRICFAFDIVPAGENSN